VKKRGLSSTIATVLIVLMAIILAVMVWAYIRSSVTDSSERVEMQEKCFAINTELQSCEYGGPVNGFYFATGLVKLIKGESTDLRVAFYAEDGTAIIKNLEPINVLETKKILPPTKINAEPSFAIASPIIYNKDESESLVCPISKKMVCNQVGIHGNLCEIPTSVEDINTFVNALIEGEGGGNNSIYSDTNPNCNITNADFNCDTSVNFGDIDPFVMILENGWIMCNKTMICEYGGINWTTNQTAIDYFNQTLCI